MYFLAFFPGHTYITKIDHTGQVKLAFQLIYNEHFFLLFNLLLQPFLWLYDTFIGH